MPGCQDVNVSRGVEKEKRLTEKEKRPTEKRVRFSPDTWKGRKRSGYGNGYGDGDGDGYGAPCSGAEPNAPPNPKPAEPGFDTSLEAWVRLCGGRRTGDKVVKVLGYAAGFAACALRYHEARNSSGPPRNGGIARSLRRIYGDVSLARMVYRFNGTQEAIEAFRNDSWADPQDDAPHMAQLVRLQALTMVAYHPLEHVYWAGYVAPELFRLSSDHECHHKRVAKVGAFSCCFWTAYVVIDIYLTLNRLRQVGERLATSTSTSNGGGEDAGAAAAAHAALRARKRHLVLQLWRDVFYLPNAVHWSFAKGILPEFMVQFLGLAEGLVGLVQALPRAS